MASNKTLLIALGGAAAAALIYRYLGTESGKQFVSNASDTLKDFAGKATDYAKDNLGKFSNSASNTANEYRNEYQNTGVGQPS